MTKELRYLFLAILLWIAADISGACAQAPDIPPGQDRIEALSTGDTAPFEGQLLDTNTAIRWTNKLLWYQKEFRLRLDMHEELMAALKRSHGRELEIAEGSYRREIEGLRSDLREQAAVFAKEQKRPFVRTGAFGFIMGVVAAGVLAGLGAAAF